MRRDAPARRGRREDHRRPAPRPQARRARRRRDPPDRRPRAAGAVRHALARALGGPRRGGGRAGAGRLRRHRRARAGSAVARRRPRRRSWRPTAPRWPRCAPTSPPAARRSAAPCSLPTRRARRRARRSACTLVFLDPPYGKGLVADVPPRPVRRRLDRAGRAGLRGGGGGARRGGPPPGFALLAERAHGPARVLFLRPAEAAGVKRLARVLVLLPGADVGGAEVHTAWLARAFAASGLDLRLAIAAPLRERFAALLGPPASPPGSKRRRSPGTPASPSKRTWSARPRRRRR